MTTDGVRSDLCCMISNLLFETLVMGISTFFIFLFFPSAFMGGGEGVCQMPAFGEALGRDLG